MDGITLADEEVSGLLDELWEQLEILQSHCVQFSAGSHGVYKSMSVILRTCLLGSSGDSALVARALPHAEFFPLRVLPVEVPTGQLATPAEITVVNDRGGILNLSAGISVPFLGIEDGAIVLSAAGPIGGEVVKRTRVKAIFDVIGTRVSLDTWLAQPFLRPEWSLSKFIKVIANKDGGAHVERNAQVTAMEGFGNIQRQIMHQIARYVAGEILAQLRQTYPAHVRILR